MKRLLALLAIAALSLAACNPFDHPSDVVERNLSTSADQFQILRRVVVPLLGLRARGHRLRADGRVRVEHLLLLGVAEGGRDLARPAERIVERGEALDEARSPLEERGQLVDAQLPR